MAPSYGLPAVSLNARKAAVLLLLTCLLLFTSLHPSAHAKIIFSTRSHDMEDEADVDDDVASAHATSAEPAAAAAAAASETADEDEGDIDMDSFGADVARHLDGPMDSGSWLACLDKPIEEVKRGVAEGNSSSQYEMGIKKLLGKGGAVHDVKGAVQLLQQAADSGHAAAQSALGFLFTYGQGVKQDPVKALLFHSFAASGGNFQSRMVLGYTFLRQQELEAAVVQYAAAAAKSMAAVSIPGMAPAVEMVRLNLGREEDVWARYMQLGEKDDTIRYIEYLAKQGNPDSCRIMAMFYYWGIRGLPRDPRLAAYYFRKAAGQGDPISMMNLGEMLVRGVGLKADYEEAMGWFKKALDSNMTAACNGIGYIHAKGLGVPKNYSKAMDNFLRAARHGDSDGQYNVGRMHLLGLGRRSNPVKALRFFHHAARSNHLGAKFHLARMMQHGIGTKKDLQQAAITYKAVAERGPWGSMLRAAHDAFLAADFIAAFALYSRAAELGYEVAQGNAAWLLEKGRRECGCVGERGERCRVHERQARAHQLWQQSSDQGNVKAALLIGDDYFYGRGTSKDLEKAVVAYRQAKDKARDSQALFNLGFMHEHGLGLPADLHLAKRYYDEALENNPRAVVPVRIALFGLWLRSTSNSKLLLQVLDSIPELGPKAVSLMNSFLRDDFNAALVALLALLVAVLFFRSQLRRAPRDVEEPPQIVE